MVLLAQWWAENYLKSHPHLVIQVNGGGSGTGIAALLNGTADICQSSRPIKDQERAAFRTKYQRDVVEIEADLPQRHRDTEKERWRDGETEGPQV